jgi:hypothetical protein
MASRLFVTPGERVYAHAARPPPHAPRRARARPSHAARERSSPARERPRTREGSAAVLKVRRAPDDRRPGACSRRAAERGTAGSAVGVPLEGPHHAPLPCGARVADRAGSWRREAAGGTKAATVVACRMHRWRRSVSAWCPPQDPRRRARRPTRDDTREGFVTPGAAPPRHPGRSLTKAGGGPGPRRIRYARDDRLDFGGPCSRGPTMLRFRAAHASRIAPGPGDVRRPEGRRLSRWSHAECTDSGARSPHGALRRTPAAAPAAPRAATGNARHPGRSLTKADGDPGARRFRDAMNVTVRNRGPLAPYESGAALRANAPGLGRGAQPYSRYGEHPEADGLGRAAAGLRSAQGAVKVQRASGTPTSWRT